MWVKKPVVLYSMHLCILCRNGVLQCVMVEEAELVIALVSGQCMPQCLPIGVSSVVQDLTGLLLHLT